MSVRVVVLAQFACVRMPFGSAEGSFGVENRSVERPGPGER